MHVPVGPGWNPFAPRPSDDVALMVTNAADHLDGGASAIRLASVRRRLVGEVCPDARIEILPPDTDDGQLAIVAFEPGDLDRFEDLTGASSKSVPDPASDGPAMVREAIFVLLGEALETPGWRAERAAGA